MTTPRSRLHAACCTPVQGGLCARPEDHEGDCDPRIAHEDGRTWTLRMVPDAADQPNMRLWDALALCFGYNELAKKATTLGERVFCRLGCDAAEKIVVECGGAIDRTGPEPVLLLREHIPHVRFMPSDIEAMRAAVAEYDAACAKGQGPR